MVAYLPPESETFLKLLLSLIILSLLFGDNAKLMQTQSLSKPVVQFLPDLQGLSQQPVGF